MKSIRKNDDAVSPVIAIILMVAITVVLAGVLYMWVNSMTDTDSKVDVLPLKGQDGNGDATTVAATEVIAANANLVALKHTGGDALNWADYTVKVVAQNETSYTLTLDATSISDSTNFGVGETAQFAYASGNLNANQQYTIQVINKESQSLSEYKGIQVS